MLARLAIICGSLIMILFIYPEEAHAYINPGVGSYLIQLAIVAITGAIFSVKLYYRKILDFFKKSAESRKATK
jgi:hypothetical protein